MVPFENSNCLNVQQKPEKITSLSEGQSCSAQLSPIIGGSLSQCVTCLK